MRSVRRFATRSNAARAAPSRAAPSTSHSIGSKTRASSPRKLAKPPRSVAAGRSGLFRVTPAGIKAVNTRSRPRAHAQGARANPRVVLMTPFLLRLLERRLAGRVPPSRLSPLLGDLLEDYHEERAVRSGWRGWIAAQIWLARECLSICRRPIERCRTRRPRPRARRRTSLRGGSPTLLDDLRQDVRDARRTFVRHPGFTVTAILTLMLGIGANATIFSVVHAILLRPLPYKDSHRLVELVGRRPAPGDRSLWKKDRRSTSARSPSSALTSRTLSHVGVHERIDDDADARRRTRTGATGGTPRVGVVPADAGRAAANGTLLHAGRRAGGRGRGRHPRVTRPGSVSSAAIRAFSAARYRSAIGKYSVVGVMDRGFQFPDTLTQFWTSVRAAHRRSRSARPPDGDGPPRRRRVDGSGGRRTRRDLCRGCPVP